MYNGLKKITRIGVENARDTMQAQAIVLSNQITLILLVVSSVFASINFVLHEVVRGFTSAALIPVLSLLILLNKFDQNKVMRLVICALPMVVILLPPILLGGKLAGTGKNYYIVLLGLSQMPFVLFRGKSENIFLYSCLAFNVFCLFSYSILIRFQGDASMETPLFWADKIKEMLGFLIIASVVWFKTSLNEHYLDDVNNLNDSLTVRNEEVKGMALELQRQHDLLDVQYKLLALRNDELARNKGHLEKLNKKIEANTEALLELAKAKAITSGEFGEGIQLIMEKAAQVLDVSRVSICVLDKETESLLCNHQFQQMPHPYLAGRRIQLKSYPDYMATLKSKKAILVSDVATENYGHEFLIEYLRPLDIRSFMDVPIFLKGELGAVICFEQQGVTKGWTTEDIFFAQALADLVTLVHESLETKVAQQEISYMNAELEQKVMERTHELSVRNKTLEEYSFYVSHVVRAPLSGMMGILNLLKMDKGQLAEPDFLEKLEANIQLMDGVIKELNAKLRENAS